GPGIGVRLRRVHSSDEVLREARLRLISVEGLEGTGGEYAAEIEEDRLDIHRGRIHAQTRLGRNSSLLSGPTPRWSRSRRIYVASGRQAGPSGSKLLYFRMNSWWPSSSEQVDRPFATARIRSWISRPTSSRLAWPSRMRPASTSMSS